MAGKLTRLGGMVAADPNGLRDLILAALAKHGYVLTAAAGELKTEYRQLARLIARLELGPEIDKRREGAGVKAPPRPPRAEPGPRTGGTL